MTILSKSAFLFSVWIFLLGAVAPVSAAEPRSPSRFAAETVAAALANAGVAPDIQTIPRAPSELREVVSRRLDARLLKGLTSIAGTDFRYPVYESDRTAHLGTIVLHYQSDAIAERMGAYLSSRPNYFRNSKILIRFSAVRLGCLMVIAYSENSGDKRIVESLKDLPTRFDEINRAEAPSWQEPQTAERDVRMGGDVAHGRD
jgi:hypothetical protein